MTPAPAPTIPTNTAGKGPLDGITLPAFLVDPDERIAEVNPAALALLGAGAQRRSLALVLRMPDLLSAVTAVLAGGLPREFETRLPDGGSWRVLVSEHRAGHALCILRDVSADTRTEEIRRDFVANVSHELRTPLTALSGFIETLRGPARDDANARERFLAIMEREAGRMNRLVRDLLHLSRVEAEERIRPRETVDLAATLRTVETSVRATADAKGSRIVLTGLEGAAPVPGDADQLMQVFLNLIENAVKYGAAGQEVQVDLLREPGLIRIDITDKGEGIDAIHLPRLTERFYRVDSHRSRAEGGTGLGLAIVKHIVNRHRGRLEIQSKKGEGSTFSVLLPTG